MEIDALILSRIQFAFVISFHILFPAFTIGLAHWLAFVEFRWLRTGRDLYRELYQFWARVFAVSFGLGVVSGIVMSFQFGTNWSRFSEITGNVLGPLFNYEVLTAFFLEASFLGVMIFGWGRVSRKVHFLATCIVAVGTLISTFWIISANSWMHTPVGAELVDGVFIPRDWWAIVFNPSFPYRLVHMVLAAFLTTSFAIAGVASWHLLRGQFVEKSRVMLKASVAFMVIVVPLQILAGDFQGLNVREHQPVKVAAMEGLWETERGAPLVLFGWPDESRESNRWSVEIPRLASFILTHDWDGEVQGLADFAVEDRPPVAPVFWFFRIMVGIGLAMLLAAAWGVWHWWRYGLDQPGWWHRFMLVMAPSGFIAILTGWFTAEIGRQPWVVYGLLRTADAVTPLEPGSVWASLILFATVYAAVFGAGSWYLLRILKAGPVAMAPAEGTPKRPMSGATAEDPG